MDADRQATTLASGSSLQVRGDSFCFLDDAPGGVEEFLAIYGRASAAIGALEKRGAQLILEMPQGPTKR